MSSQQAPEARDARNMGILDRYHGAKPPAPAWFDEALSMAPQRIRVSVEGAGIETLIWGDEGAPGILLLHGSNAHADWWSFVAPFLAHDSRIAAISWSGMGGSDWRDQYSVELYMAEAMTCAQAAGLFGRTRPLLVAHSFAATPAIRLAAESGDRFERLLLLDTTLFPPGKEWRGLPTTQSRLYPSLEAALARFQLRPVQPCDNHYILDHVAREGLRRVSDPDNGWAWRFDPALWSKLPHHDLQRSPADLARAKCALTFIMGEKSGRMNSDAMAYTKRFAPAGTRFFAIPEAGHHLWLDQPLAFVTALRAARAEMPG